MRKLKITYILIFAVSLFAIYYAYTYDLPKLFTFDKKTALEEWKEKIFGNKVMYVVKSDQKAGYLSAKSEKACSGLFYRITIDIKKLPMISWHWKVIKFPEKSAAETRDIEDKKGWLEKDDYAARIYVIFPRFNFSRTQCIEYIWDKNLPEGTIMTSPYSKNIKLIVVESGKRIMGPWTFEERNIYKDYEKAFGKAPRYNVGAIALMTDTDNTLSTAEALYKDIKVGYKNE